MLVDQSDMEEVDLLSGEEDEKEKEVGEEEVPLQLRGKKEVESSSVIPKKRSSR